MLVTKLVEKGRLSSAVSANIIYLIRIHFCAKLCRWTWIQENKPRITRSKGGRRNKLEYIVGSKWLRYTITKGVVRPIGATEIPLEKAQKIRAIDAKCKTSTFTLACQNTHPHFHRCIKVHILILRRPTFYWPITQESCWGSKSCPEFLFSNHEKFAFLTCSGKKQCFSQAELPL